MQPMVQNDLTVVMYHYVRDLGRSRYPRIKGLDAERFRGQVRLLAKHWTPIAMEQLLAALDGEEALPPRAVLLTFDDGYSDHFDVVLPILDELGVPAAFFPPARAVIDGELLDVNKIHFLLACADDPAALARRLFDQLALHRAQHELPPDEHYVAALAHPSRFDPAEVVLIKRMLQRELPPLVRATIADQLFTEIVGVPPGVFARELYMTADQIRYLVRAGFHVGGHGHDHVWLGTLGREQQEQEVALTRSFLESVGADPTRWSFAYPYGSWGPETPAILRAHGCRAALTTDVSVARLSADPVERDAARFRIPRLDTNDLPCDPGADLASWSAPTASAPAST